MLDYNKLYLFLFNKISNALQEIEKQNFGKAKEVLQKAQQEAEENYISDTTEE